MGTKKAIPGEARVLVWDVQAVKLAPQNKAGILYYKSKLKNHYFSIYDLQSTDCTNGTKQMEVWIRRWL